MLALRAVQDEQLLVVPDKGLERPGAQMLSAVATLCALMVPDR
ncbi:hypothetical protein [Pseudomonas sp. R5(2019)]|nr:hypothetical protein [Pseudomonas sp. R5(2019)]